MSSQQVNGLFIVLSLSVLSDSFALQAVDFEVVDRMAQNFEYALEKSVEGTDLGMLSNIHNFTNQVLMNVQSVIDNEPKSRRVVFDGVGKMQELMIYNLFKDHFQHTMNILHSKIDNDVNSCKTDLLKRELELQEAFIDNQLKHENEIEYYINKLRLLQGQMQFILNPKYWADWFLEEDVNSKSSLNDTDTQITEPVISKATKNYEDDNRFARIPDNILAEILDIKEYPYFRSGDDATLTQNKTNEYKIENHSEIQQKSLNKNRTVTLENLSQLDDVIPDHQDDVRDVKDFNLGQMKKVRYNGTLNSTPIAQLQADTPIKIDEKYAIVDLLSNYVKKRQATKK